MTVFERWQMAAHAMQCIADQTHTDWELLVYSDGPCPGQGHPWRFTRELKKQCSQRIEFHELERLNGFFGNRARHRGLQEANGDYIVWMSHDNLIRPEYLQVHAETIENKHPCISVVPIHFWLPGRYVGVFPFEYQQGKFDLLNFAVPVDTAREVGAFNVTLQHIYAADWEVFKRCRDSGLRIEENHRHGPVGAHF